MPQRENTEELIGGHIVWSKMLTNVPAQEGLTEVVRGGFYRSKDVKKWGCDLVHVYAFSLLKHAGESINARENNMHVLFFSSMINATDPEIYAIPLADFARDFVARVYGPDENPDTEATGQHVVFKDVP